VLYQHKTDVNIIESAEYGSLAVTFRKGFEKPSSLMNEDDKNEN